MAKLSRREIRNGTAFPLSLKNAALGTWDATSRSKVMIAREYNVSKSTMTKWVAERGTQRGPQPIGLQRHQAAAALVKAHNTMTMQADGKIAYKGKIYVEEKLYV